MDIRKKWYWLAVLMVAAGLVSPLMPRASAQEAVLVGRIAHTEGQVLRFVPETQDWVATVKDAPFGLNDTLYSAPQARAELMMPNGLGVRIGASTQIQLLALQSDASDLDVASGVARFYNKSAHGVVKAATPFGYVLAEPHATFDLSVGDQSVEVLALKGDVAFIHSATNARYNVVPGGGSILANATQVATGDGNLDADWDDWNAGRDRLWAQRGRARGESIRHVPPQLQDDAYALEENGRWGRVHYQGEDHEFWRPTTVAATWQPFTVGRWTEWYGDQTWVPDEPFGYVTHHYGNWVVVNGVWYWAPPVATVAVATGPLLGFAWYPGRVAWIHSDVDIGWVPLAPTEVYYSHIAWGPRAVVVATAPVVSLSIGSLAFAHAAVVVPQTAFYSGPTYTAVRVTNINQTTIVNKFRPAPVVNNTVINNYTQITSKYDFATVHVTQKPHSEVVTRINQNRQIATQQAPTVNAAAFRQTLATTPPTEPVKQAAVPPPTVTNKIVPANQVHAPANQVQFQPVEVKKNPRPATTSPAVQPAAGAPPGAPGAHPQPPGASTTQPGQPTPPTSPRPGAAGVQPQPPRVPGTQPAQPGAPGIPSPRPGVQPPTRPGEQLQRPGVQPPAGRPSEPASPGMGPPTSAPGAQPSGMSRPGGQEPPRMGQPPQGQQPGGMGRPGAQPPRLAQPPAAQQQPSPPAQHQRPAQPPQQQQQQQQKKKPGEEQKQP